MTLSITDTYYHWHLLSLTLTHRRNIFLSTHSFVLYKSSKPLLNTFTWKAAHCAAHHLSETHSPLFHSHERLFSCWLWEMQRFNSLRASWESEILCCGSGLRGLFDAHMIQMRCKLRTACVRLLYLYNWVPARSELLFRSFPFSSLVYSTLLWPTLWKLSLFILSCFSSHFPGDLCLAEATAVRRVERHRVASLNALWLCRCLPWGGHHGPAGSPAGSPGQLVQLGSCRRDTKRKDRHTHGMT